MFTKYMAKDDGASLIVFCYVVIAILTGFLFRRPKVAFYVSLAFALAGCAMLIVFKIPLEGGGLVHMVPFAFVSWMICKWREDRVRTKRGGGSH
jgi:hypothetical protein